MTRILAVPALLVLAVLALLAVLVAQSTAPEPVAAPYDYSSRYLMMRDGVRIAIDVYVPRGIAPGAKVPTILHQTRYFRSHRVVWLASFFWDGHLEPTIKRYAARGYAYVVVDVRGSGASFGTRTQEWSPDEARDGGEVADWIVKQPWSNGRIGSTGASYEGTATDYLLSNGHPAVRATAPRSGQFDAYADVAFPGGVKQGPFVDLWSRMTAAQDSNRMNSVLTGIAKMAYRGVKPVQGDSGEELLAAAAREHTKNYNVAAGIGKEEFTDNSSQVQAMSPYTIRERIERSGAAIFSMSGWYDAAYLNSAIKRFLTVKTPGSRLILGPWNHQGENHSPFAAKLKDFDQNAEILRFFDHTLKDEANGLGSELPVRYYTVGEEKWKSAPTWPPPGTGPQALFLGASGALAAGAPGAAPASDRYAVDFTTGTGQQTRWNSQTGLDLDNAHGLPRDRRERDKKLLVYDGAPLTAELEVTGHPIVSLFVESTDADGAVFVYLEDVDPNGAIHYVTEGMLRLIHHKTNPAAAPYMFPGPYRTYAKADALPMVRGEVAKIEFDLFPISYLFRAGHSIRIAIAGADADHFAQYPAAPAAPPTLTIYRDAAHPSQIVLPVMRR